MNKVCIECYNEIRYDEYAYSLKKYNVPLCRPHQEWFKALKATDHALLLYFALKKRGVPAELEKFDGHKTIDIAIVECRVNIEVDGKQHHNPNQALADLKRTYFSFLK